MTTVGGRRFDHVVQHVGWQLARLHAPVVHAFFVEPPQPLAIDGYPQGVVSVMVGGQQVIQTVAGIQTTRTEKLPTSVTFAIPQTMVDRAGYNRSCPSRSCVCASARKLPWASGGFPGSACQRPCSR